MIKRSNGKLINIVIINLLNLLKFKRVNLMEK